MNGFAKAQREYENREPPEEDWECTCAPGILTHWDCDEMQDEIECDCIGHVPSCGICNTSHGCRCDEIYEAWKDSRLEEREES